MGRSKKQIYPMLCIILMLTGVLILLYLNPAILQTLPWLSPDENTPNPPAEQPDGDEPLEGQPPEGNPPEGNPPEGNPPEQQIPAETIVSLTGRYYTYEEMKQDMALLASRYPDTMSYRSYGTSADGRDLLVATLGNPDAEGQVIITAGMHAREYVNSFAVMQQLEYYLVNYDTAIYGGHTLRELFDEICFVIVPMTNPDGITMAQEGLEAIRISALRDVVRNICRAQGITGEAAIDKYLNNYWKSNARGVDINRNFDALWVEHFDGIGKPWVQNYKGYAAMSEVESAYLAALTESLSNPVASVCVHSQGEIIYWRCFQEGVLEIQNRRLAEVAARITGYAIIDENQTEPSFSNWTILAHGIPTITVETGLGGYPQNHATMADQIYGDIRDLWAALALEYGDFAKG
jgi:g-D-glutamyl-meso-diaminopimelate peptidase